MLLLFRRDGVVDEGDVCCAVFHGVVERGLIVVVIGVRRGGGGERECEVQLLIVQRERK